MRLHLEKKADYHCNNLFTADEVAIIILDKYNRANFCNIILAYQHLENNIPKFQNISSIIVAYIPLHYVLFFSIWKSWMTLDIIII